MPAARRTDRISLPVRWPLLCGAPVHRPPRLLLRLQGRRERGHREGESRREGREDREGLKTLESEKKKKIRSIGETKTKLDETERRRFDAVGDLKVLTIAVRLLI